MEDDFMGPMVGIMMALVMVSLISGIAVAAPDPTPTQEFECPLEPGVFFNTYDELYQHFITAHPSDPIDIIWS